MNPRIQKLAEAEINRATAAMKEFAATADRDEVLLAVIQKIGTNITTAINSEIVELKGQLRVHAMVMNGREMLKEKPVPQKPTTTPAAIKAKQEEQPGTPTLPPEVKP